MNLVHPDAKQFGVFDGSLEYQDHEFETGIAMLRSGFAFDLTTLESDVELYLYGSVTVKGAIQGEIHISLNGTIEFEMIHLDGSTEYVTHVAIDSKDHIHAEVWVNPPDQNKQHHLSNPPVTFH